MSGLLTDGFAMTLTLVILVVLMVGAVFVIVFGGRLARDRNRPKRQVKTE